jgi:hypothetical protein
MEFQIAAKELLTLQRRETTVHDEFQITQLTLSEDNSGESLSLGAELLLAGSIAGEQVLEDTTVGSVGHCEKRV